MLEPEESIGGMLKVLGELKDGKKEQGTFFRYDGTEIEW